LGQEPTIGLGKGQQEPIAPLELGIQFGVGAAEPAEQFHGGGGLANEIEFGELLEVLEDGAIDRASVGKAQLPHGQGGFKGGGAAPEKIADE
jgi:hypothetical protein